MKFTLVVTLSMLWFADSSVSHGKKLNILKKNVNRFTSQHFAQRIVGGEPARAGQFPYAAAITTKTNTSTIFCTASILTNRWILTTAHCVDNGIGFIITFGSHILDGNDTNRETVSASAYIKHPDYNPNTLDSDIALIQLREDITFTNYISWIYLPTTDVTKDTTVTAFGWGQTSDHEGAPVNTLHWVNLVTISNEDCKSFYGEQITDNMVCIAGNSNEGTCTGDAGSPLVYYLNNRHPVHVGTACFISGNGCEGSDPSGYIRTHRYRDWLLQITETIDLYA